MKNQMNSPLTIPPEILCLKDVTMTGKAILAMYTSNPTAKDFELVQILGFSLLGLKKAKVRLMEMKLLKSTASGYHVILPNAINKVSPNQITEKGNEVTALPKVKSVEEIISSHNSTMKSLRENLPVHASTLLMVTQETLRQIQSDLPECSGKDVLVKGFTTRCDAFFALDYVFENLPVKHHRDADHLIAHAKPEQLAKLRASIELARLTGGMPTLLLAELSCCFGKRA